MSVYCIINQTMRLSDPTRKVNLAEPLAYSNQRAHAFRVTVVGEDGETPADLSGVGCTGRFYKVKSDETVLPILGTISGNTAEVILPASCYTTPGRFTFTMDLAASSEDDEALLDAYAALDMSEVSARDTTIGAVMNMVFGLGNVNLLTRPQVNAADLGSAGYSGAGTGTATVFSVEYYLGSGTGVDYSYPKNVILHLTPIKADGTIVTKTDLESYINTTLKTTASIAEMLTVDNARNGGLGLILWVQPVTGWTQEQKDLGTDWDTYLSNMQAAYYLADTTTMPTKAQLETMYTAGHGETWTEIRTVLWVDGIVERVQDGTIIDPGTPVGNITQVITAANAAANSAISAAANANAAATRADNAVSYSVQTGKSEEAKANARKNIGAVEPDFVNALHGLVDYDFSTPGTRSVGSANFTRSGILLAISGSNETSTTPVRARLNGGFNVIGTSTVPSGWGTGLALTAGHTYRWTVRQVRGTATKPPLARVYAEGSFTDIGGTAADSERNSVYTFTYASTPVNLCMVYSRSGGGASFTDCAYECTLTDENSDRDLPPAPTTAGTYTLKVTVANGIPSYAWVSDALLTSGGESE